MLKEQPRPTRLMCVIFAVSLIAVASAEEPETPRCLSMEAATEKNFDLDAMRQEYVPAFVIGSDDCAFPDKGREGAEALRDVQLNLLQSLADDPQVTVNDLTFFSLVFFDKDGAIQYFFHRGLEPEQGNQVCKMVRNLSKDYRFPLSATRPFSQCRTVRLQ